MENALGHPIGSDDEIEEIEEQRVEIDSPPPTLADARASLKKIQKFLVSTEKADDKQCLHSLATLENVIDECSVVRKKQVDITSFFQKS